MRALAVTAAGAAVIALGLAAAALAKWWNAPAPVPDHAAPFVATTEMKVFGTTTLAQVVRPTLDRITGVDLVVAAERAGLPGMVRLSVEEWPSRRVVRTAAVPAARAPEGSAWRYRPGQSGERWLSFGFEPIEGSAGRDFLFVLSYPDGHDVAGARIATLAHFPSRYPPGDLLVNDDPKSGTLLFRLAAAGTRGAALDAAFRNLARAQPVLQGTLVFPGALTAACVCLAAALAAAVVKRW